MPQDYSTVDWKPRRFLKRIFSIFFFFFFFSFFWRKILEFVIIDHYTATEERFIMSSVRKHRQTTIVTGIFLNIQIFISILSQSHYSYLTLSADQILQQLSGYLM
jgi:hypothetical protein